MQQEDADPDLCDVTHLFVNTENILFRYKGLMDRRGSSSTHECRETASTMETHVATSPQFHCSASNTDSRSMAYRLLASGQLTAVKIGKSTRVRGEDAERWAANLTPYRPTTA